jgi:tRNA threonylcarbamoyladenosine biosynthesis protein TsaB
MKLLAVDTSSDFLGLAVLEDDTVMASIVKKSDKMHASVLVPMVREILGMSGFSFGSLDGFVVDIGPGSFTGLRIGVSTVKGFLCASKKGIKQVRSLDVIAANIGYSDLDICTILDAKRGNFYFCIFKYVSGCLKPVSKYLLLRLDEIVFSIKKPTIFLGDGLLIIKDLLKKRLGRLVVFADKGFWYPDPRQLGLLGYAKIKKKGFDDVGKFLPFYIYPKECTITIPNKYSIG